MSGTNCTFSTSKNVLKDSACCSAFRCMKIHPIFLTPTLLKVTVFFLRHECIFPSSRAHTHIKHAQMSLIGNGSSCEQFSPSPPLMLLSLFLFQCCKYFNRIARDILLHGLFPPHFPFCCNSIARGGRDAIGSRTTSEQSSRLRRCLLCHSITSIFPCCNGAAANRKGKGRKVPAYIPAAIGETRMVTQTEAVELHFPNRTHVRSYTIGHRLCRHIVCVKFRGAQPYGRKRSRAARQREPSTFILDLDGGFLQSVRTRETAR